MNKSHGLLLILCLALCACANPIVGTLERNQAIKICTEKAKDIGDLGTEFIQDGHLYTTLAIADIVQLPKERQLVLSYYTQYPDIDPDYGATPVAIKYLFLPWKYRWRNSITGKLHSLHGGDYSHIQQRRKNIGESLNETIKDPSLDWLSGLIIHAYGDAYAHTKFEYASEFERAYNVWLGHAWATLMRKSPDDIKRNAVTEEKYLRYIQDFYTHMKPDGTSDHDFKQFKKFVEDYQCTGGSCPNFHAKYTNQDPSNNKIDFFRDCMNNTSRPLSPQEVSQAFGKIDP